MSVNQDEISEELYYQKYLKYKNKYFELSNFLGGAKAAANLEKAKKLAEAKALKDLSNLKKGSIGRNKFLTQKCWIDESKFKVEKDFKATCLRCSLEGANPGVQGFKCCTGYKQMWTVLKQGDDLDLQRLCEVCHHAFGYHGAVTGGDGEITFRSLKEKKAKEAIAALTRVADKASAKSQGKQTMKKEAQDAAKAAIGASGSAETPAETTEASETPAEETPAEETEG